ncbi:hypothetical protein SPRG_02759 [Saprolegnia parasitica CBS 223.65]|uniref:Jacalin-type lectin domain-containing protein n=1 Tax=Saprolegnia parasitica (strain CBS 223.65) TaxID=695850 RepID=A0A067CSR5_SAPPC|nr:hypothetical protein SPRG_02759 [Saprolegnia parasitica CBS 223.65]KDO32280.1 hypothetical protein SPRG_02759 [Saprolegnia parasitica CBS 223.65]|eukprot:XP_012196736.1 hypothetical protein SPRG_02759 [Saprolegnia parasitica CBS 223.65]
MEDEARIEITSADDARYPLKLMEGRFHCSWELPDNVLAEIYVDDQASAWPVTHDGRFKALLALPSVGQHEVCINIAETYHILSIDYAPAPATHHVRVYLASDASRTEADLAKVRFFASVLQTAFGALTGTASFSLQVDEHGQPLVHALDASHVDAAIKALPDYASTLATTTHLVLLDGSLSDETCTDRYASLVVLGMPNVAQWPEGVGSLNKSFLDNDQYTAALSNGLHQLGHAFGLGHTRDGVMALPAGRHAIDQLLSVYTRKPNARVAAYAKAFPDGKLFVNYAGVDTASSLRAHWHAASSLRLQKSPFVCGASGRVPTIAPKVLWPGPLRGPVGLGGHIPFGSDYRGRSDVAGFLFHADASHVLDIEILSQGALNDLLFAGLSASGNQDMFLLMDNEYILQIDVTVSNKGQTIAALRFHTNLRTTRFFGGRGGGLETLTPPPGHHFYSLFGTSSSAGVGSLGAYFTPLPPHASRPGAPTATETSTTPVASMADQLLQQFNTLFSLTPPPAPASTASGSFATIGLGSNDGDQDAFVTPRGHVGAILLTCTDAIASLKTLSATEYANKCRDGYYCSDDEHVFSLLPHEVIIQVDVRSSEWIHALRFHTNRRISPWFGGDDGVENAFVCATDACITGFYGSHGHHYLGTLGAYFGPAPRGAPPASISLHPPPTLPTSVREDALAGVQIDVANGRLALSAVRSLAETASLSPSQSLFLLQRGEALVQVDVCRSGLDDATIVGVCLHAQTRCSAFYGRLTDVYERLGAPTGDAILSMTMDNESEVQVTFAPLHDCVRQDDVTVTDAVDMGADHLEVVAPDGHFMLVLHAVVGADLVAVAVVHDPKRSTTPPRSMFYPLSVLQQRVDGPLSDYVVEVVDETGSASRVRVPL